MLRTLPTGTLFLSPPTWKFSILCRRLFTSWPKAPGLVGQSVSIAPVAVGRSVCPSTFSRALARMIVAGASAAGGACSLRTHRPRTLNRHGGSDWSAPSVHAGRSLPVVPCMVLTRHANLISTAYSSPLQKAATSCFRRHCHSKLSCFKFWCSPQLLPFPFPVKFIICHSPCGFSLLRCCDFSSLCPMFWCCVADPPGCQQLTDPTSTLLWAGRAAIHSSLAG